MRVTLTYTKNGVQQTWVADTPAALATPPRTKKLASMDMRLDEAADVRAATAVVAKVCATAPELYRITLSECYAGEALPAVAAAVLASAQTPHAYVRVDVADLDTVYANMYAAARNQWTHADVAALVRLARLNLFDAEVMLHLLEVMAERGRADVLKGVRFGRMSALVGDDHVGEIAWDDVARQPTSRRVGIRLDWMHDMYVFIPHVPGVRLASIVQSACREVAARLGRSMRLGAQFCVDNAILDEEDTLETCGGYGELRLRVRPECTWSGRADSPPPMSLWAE